MLGILAMLLYGLSHAYVAAVQWGAGRFAGRMRGRGFGEFGGRGEGDFSMRGGRGRGFVPRGGFGDRGRGRMPGRWGGR